MPVTVKHAGGEVDLGEVARLAEIRAQLPARLAELADAGQETKALDLLRAWGNGKMTLEELWKEAS